MVVPSDLSELLTKDAGIHAASFDLALPSNDAPPSEKLHQFRMLILSGRKKVGPVCVIVFTDHFPLSCVCSLTCTAGRGEGERGDIKPLQHVSIKLTVHAGM